MQTIKLLGALLSAFLLAACQSTVTTFKVGNEEISGTLAVPEGKGPFPAVVLLHTCGGVMMHISNDWPNFLTKLGYATLTVDSFGSRGVGKCPNRVGNFTMISDAYGALDHLAIQPFIDGDRVAIFGFSKGGIVVNEIAKSKLRNSRPNFKAGISFYGSCYTLWGAEKKIRFPLMEIFGDKDTETKNCIGLSENSKLKIVKLPNTYHNFDVYESSGRTNSIGTYMQYSSEATKKARELSKIFLSTHIR